MERTPGSGKWQDALDWSFGLIEDLRLAWRLIGDDRVSWVVKAIPVAAVVYVLSPIDFIPDFFLGVGQLDDLALLVLGLKAFISMSPQPVVDQYLRELRGGGAGRSAGPTNPDDSDYVTAEYRVLDDDR